MAHRRGRSLRPLRRRVFLGCEGESEQSYGRLLQSLADESGIPVTIEAVLLKPGAGDPAAALDLAIRKRKELQASRSPFEVCAVLLDADRRATLSKERMQQAERAAEADGIVIIWQRPDHEGFLLRHMPGCADRRPDTHTLEALCKAWPEYRKGLPALRLRSRLGWPEVLQACRAEPALCRLLQQLGFPLPDDGP